MPAASSSIAATEHHRSIQYENRSRVESESEARATHHAPSLRSIASSEATTKASRVLPHPPGPVSVSRRESVSRSLTSATSRSRPRSSRAPAAGYGLEVPGRAGQILPLRRTNSPKPPRARSRRRARGPTVLSAGGWCHRVILLLALICNRPAKSEKNCRIVGLSGRLDEAKGGVHLRRRS